MRRGDVGQRRRDKDIVMFQRGVVRVSELAGEVGRFGEEMGECGCCVGAVEVDIFCAN